MNKIRFGFFLAILASLVMALVSCREEQGKTPSSSQSGQIGNVDTAGKGTGSSDLYAGDVVAWVDGYAVRMGELQNFATRHLGEPHSDPHKPQGQAQTEFDFASVFDAWLRHHLLVREAERRGLDREPAVVEWETFSFLLSRFEDYRRHLYENAEISSDRLNASLPKVWTRMNFALRVFPDMTAAWEARRKVTSRDAFMKLPIGFTGGTRKEGGPETGMIWQDSGFFKKVDEGVLYKLEEGQVSDPVESGLGPALCLVLEKRVYTEQEKRDYLAEVRDRLSEEYVNATLQKVAEEGPFKVRADLIEQAWSEGRGPTSEQAEFTALEFKGEEVSYRTALSIRPANLGWMRRVQPRERWGQFITSHIRGLGQMLSWGAEAEELDIPVSASVKRSILERKQDHLYDIIQEKIAAEAVSAEISEGDLKTFYEGNIERFQKRDSLWINYYFSPFIDALEPLLRKYREEKVSFDELGQYLPNAGARAPHAMADSAPMKVKTMFQGDPELPGVQESLFQYQVGHVGIFKTSMGEYLVHIRDRRTGETLPFEKAKTAAKDLMKRSIQERAISEALKEIMSRTQIVFSREGEERKGSPGKGTADFS